MASLIIGSFTLVKSENFDEFMKALGVGLVTRKMGNAVYPTVTFSESGGEYTMKTSSTFKTTEIKFKLGEQFEETTLDGRQAKSTMTLDGNVLTQVQKYDKGADVTYIRTFNEADMVTVGETAGVKSTRTYKRN